MKRMNEPLVKFFFIISETTAHVKHGAAEQALKNAERNARLRLPKEAQPILFIMSPACQSP